MDIKETRVSSSKCPAKECNHTITENEAESILGPDFPKYKAALKKECDRKDPLIAMCPRENCNGSTRLDKKPIIIEFLICNSCNCSYCCICGLEKVFHKEKCEAVDESSLNYQKKNTKPCPSCKSQIEKSIGCDHMTCTKCEYEFCYICLGPYYVI